LTLTTPNFRKQLEVFVPGWLVYVNREGRRFVKETAEYAVMSGVVKAQTGGSCFAIFDDEAKRAAKPIKKYADAFAAGIIPLNWVAEELEAQLKTGRVIRGETLDELAIKCGIRPGSLNATVDKYNADTDAGADSFFFKNPADMKPIRTGPFYAVEVRPAIVCLTSTGVRIDRDAHALDELDRPIRGLFAGGETTGGVLGERYIGGGNSIANAIVFGRIAGRNAAAEARRNV
jgi:fumarate reductase flavoprotein subunit